MQLADTYARTNQTEKEFALYQDLLKELATRADGVPLGDHFDQLAASVEAHQPFAGGDGGGGTARNPGHGLDVFRRARLFDEQQIQWLHLFHQDRGDAGHGLRVEIHRDVDVRAEGFAEHLHRLDGGADLLARLDPYFEDMNLVIRNMSAYLKLGGRVALVVANAQFNGENVPTDLMLCELAERHGLTTESIWVTRFKGNSSQQMAIYGRRPVRETIVFWRKYA